MKSKNNGKTIIGTVMVMMALSIIAGSVFADFENGLISFGSSEESTQGSSSEDSIELDLEELNLVEELLEELDDEDMRDLIEEEFEEYDSNMSETKEEHEVIMPPYYPKKNFVLYTDDGSHVMWGEIFNQGYYDEYAENEDYHVLYEYSYFTSKDSDGRKAFGVIKGDEFFGFYDYGYDYNIKSNSRYVGKGFFHGTIHENEWKAQGLFGLKSGHGEIKMFYPNYINPTTAEPSYDDEDYDEKPLEIRPDKKPSSTKPDYKRTNLKKLLKR